MAVIVAVPIIVAAAVTINSAVRSVIIPARGIVYEKLVNKAPVMTSVRGTPGELEPEATSPTVKGVPIPRTGTVLASVNGVAPEANAIMVPDPIAEAPVGPWAPVGPVNPIDPVGPVNPVGPIGPVNPVGPVGPSDPVCPVN